MKRIPALLLFLSTLMSADGPPVDRVTGAITAPHETITATAAQVREIDSLGTITLDASQAKRLRRRHPHAPTRLLVLPLMYADCTCGMEPYALRTGPKTVAMPIRSLDVVRYLEGMLTAGGGTLRLGSDGQLLYLGARFSFAQFRDVFVRIDFVPNDESYVTQPVLFVALPEPYPPQSPAVVRTVEALRTLLPSRGWRLAFEEATESGSPGAGASPNGGT
jgi:hypothetical protein